MKIKVEKITKKDVIAWFKKQGKIIVGMPGEADACPLAGYVSSKGFNDVEVDGHGIAYYYEIISDAKGVDVEGSVRVRYPAPAWAKKFIDKIDAFEKGSIQYKYADGVTGTKAAKILSAIR